MFGYGGGIYNGSPLEILNSTISDNTADYGAGLYNEFAVEMGLTNTIIANSIRGGDCLNDKGTISTNINNLVEDGTCSDGGLNFKTGDPLLDVLGDNGGLTQTLALLPGSPAIDAGDTSLGPLTDQRGVYRPQGFQTDIGAYELVQYMIYLPLIMSNE
jgi:hypothetical protein